MYYIGYNYYYTYLILPFSYNGVTPLAKFILFPHNSLYDNLLSTLLIKQFVDELDYFSYLSDGAKNSRKGQIKAQHFLILFIISKKMCSNSFYGQASGKWD